MTEDASYAPSEPPTQAPPVVFASVYTAHVEPLVDHGSTIMEAGSVRVDLWPGPFELQFETERREVAPRGVSFQPMRRLVRFPESSNYLVMRTQVVPYGDDRLARASVGYTFAKVAALFEMTFPGVLAEREFEGVLAKEGEFTCWPEYPLEAYPYTPRSPEEMAKALKDALALVKDRPEEDRRRLAMSSRLLMKGTTTTNPIDRMLWLWTALEVHVEEDTDVINVIRDRLAGVLGRDKGEVKTKLMLGECLGFRCDIVHRGMMYVPREQDQKFSACTKRLEAVVVACMRLLAGMPLGDLLEPFFGESAPR